MALVNRLTPLNRLTRPFSLLPSRAWGQLVFWGLYACFMAWAWSSGSEAHPFSASTRWLISLLVAGVLGLGSELFRLWALKGRWLERSPMAIAWRTLLCVPLIAFAAQWVIRAGIHQGQAAGLLHLPQEGGQGSTAALIFYTVNSCILLWMWAAGWLTSQALRRWRAGEIERWRVEAESQQLQMRLLQAQLKPHFLFNAINNVRSLILEDPMRAREMLGSLSNTLQHSLRQHQAPLVSLDDELRLVHDYLALQQLHHEHRLNVHWELGPGVQPPAAQALQVPPLSLQLLVENAIAHGIARTRGGGTLGIGLRCDAAGTLTVEVSNPGEYAPPQGPRESGGVGLENLRLRLSRLTPAGRLEVGPGAHGVMARMVIPQARP
jgi:hypothetical protein